MRSSRPGRRPAAVTACHRHRRRARCLPPDPTRTTRAATRSVGSARRRARPTAADPPGSLPRRASRPSGTRRRRRTGPASPGSPDRPVDSTADRPTRRRTDGLRPVRQGARWPPSAGAHARIGSPPREGPPPAGVTGRRARTPVSRRPLIRPLSACSASSAARSGWYASGDNGTPRSLHIRRGAIAKPVRVRHSPATVTAPSWGGSPVADLPFRSSLREKGQAHRAIDRLTPPSIPKRGVFHVPATPPTRNRSPRGRTLTSDAPSSRDITPRPAAVPARDPRGGLRRRRRHRPARRRRHRSPRRRRLLHRPPHRPRPDRGADPGPDLPGHADRRRGDQRHPRGRARRRSSRSPRPPPRPCSRSGWATSSSARSRTSRRTRPRRPSPDVAKFGVRRRREDRGLVPTS